MLENKLEILKDERVVFRGKPETGKIFTIYDIILIPFTIAWLSFACIWEFMVAIHIKDGGKVLYVFVVHIH